MTEIQPVSPSYPIQKIKKVMPEREQNKDPEPTYQEQKELPDDQDESVPHINEIV